jgi:UPF0755 protein
MKSEGSEGKMSNNENSENNIKNRLEDILKRFGNDTKKPEEDPSERILAEVYGADKENPQELDETASDNKKSYTDYLEPQRDDETDDTPSSATDSETDDTPSITTDRQTDDLTPSPAPELDTEKKAIYEALLKNMDDREKIETEGDGGFDEEDLSAEPQIRRRRKKKSSVGHLIFSLVLVTFIVSAAFLCAGFVINIGRELLGIGKPDTEIVLEIPETDSMSRVADIFIEDGIIDDKDLFLFFTRVRGLKTVVPGAHEFSANMTYGEIADELQSAATEEEREAIDIMFPEGTTLLGAGEILELADICKASEFVETFNSESFGFDFESRIKTSSLKFYKMEGYCFPDTYRFYRDEDVKSLVKKIYRNFEAKLTPDLVQRMTDMELSQDELITFASVVQMEAGRLSDMRMVASVFWNRLNNPDEFPLLQSDPTGKYVRNVIMPHIEVESEEMYNAYDTYEGVGLPPGPICNPGLDAINAVLYPADTTYFFFCSNIETGEFYFATELGEHEENLVIAGLAG